MNVGWQIGLGSPIHLDEETNIYTGGGGEQKPKEKDNQLNFQHKFALKTKVFTQGVEKYQA